MPAKSHPVAPTMWNRNTHRMSKDALIALMFVRTCPQRVTEGIFKLAPRHIAADTPLTEEEAEAALGELHALGEIAYDADAEIVLDPHALRVQPLRIKHDRDTGERRPPDKRLGTFLDRLDVLPDTPLKQTLVSVAQETGSDLLLEALAQRSDQAPSKPLGSPSEGASRGEQSRDDVEQSSDEPSRTESSVEHVEPLPLEPQAPRCSKCGDRISDRDLNAHDGLCGWCAPSAQAVAL